MSAEYRSEPLDDFHRIDPFDCGVPELDRWLREQALRAQRQGTARTTVWIRGDDRTVLACHAVTPTTVTREGLPRRVAGGITSIPGISSLGWR